MKRVVLSFLFLSFLSTAFIKASDPVIMKIAGKDIKKSEFEYIWNKNNTNNAVDKKSLEDYLDLFVNFKLKVAEAKFQGIDTTKSFINELNGYRNQLTAQAHRGPQAPAGGRLLGIVGRPAVQRNAGAYPIGPHLG